MYSIIRKILFSLPPETSHHLTLTLLNIMYAAKLTGIYKQILSPSEVMGLTFPNPVGLAAGLDKNADYFEALSSLGFGFVEVGTITPNPQIGNAKPRLFRLAKQSAIINRMGFNNKGLDYVEERLTNLKWKGILGINLGKNKDTPLEQAIDDYAIGLRRMTPYASYITINISSPNTAGLRDLQQSSYLRELLSELKRIQLSQSKYVPLVVKVAPDLTNEEITEIAEVLLSEKIDGLIATNTTLQREGVEESPFRNEAGGLSGQPLFSQSTFVLKEFHKLIGHQIPIIGSGGVMTVEDAKHKFEAGASLIQLYTGFIYHGPKLIEQICKYKTRLRHS